MTLENKQPQFYDFAYAISNSNVVAPSKSCLIQRLLPQIETKRWILKSFFGKNVETKKVRLTLQ